MAGESQLKVSLLAALSGMVSRILAKIQGIEDEHLCYVADKVLDKPFMDVTEDRAYWLPPAASVKAGTRRTVRHPDKYASVTTPDINCSGNDLIDHATGTSASVTMDQGNAVVVVFVSNGVDKWVL